MPLSETTLLGQEWLVLQTQYEQYEKNSLLIKLLAIVLCFSAHVMLINTITMVAIILVLWLQEGIFKTYQSRLGERILRIESLIKQNIQTDIVACQLHSEWLAGRKGVIGLILEYALSAARPTVAFPYVVILLITAALL